MTPGVRHAVIRHQGGIVDGSKQRIEITFNKSIVDLPNALRFSASLLLRWHIFFVGPARYAKRPF